MHVRLLRHDSADGLGRRAEQRQIIVAVADPAADDNVTKELMVLGTNDLPIEYDQWEGIIEVKRVTYSDVSLNVDLPDSTFVL